MNPPESAAQGSEAGNLNKPHGETSEPVRPPAPEAAPTYTDEQLKTIETEHQAAMDDEPERPDWDAEEDEKLAAIEREITESTERVMQSDDKLAAAHVEIKRQAAVIVGLKSSRDHYQSETGAAVRLVKARDREIEKLKKDLAKSREENEALRERIAIVETA